MATPLLDTDAGSELFSSYEAELKLVQADLNQKLDQIKELSGEPRKSAIRLAERSLEEANELVRPFQYQSLYVDTLTPSLLSCSSTKCASRNKTSPPPPAQK